MIAIATLTAVLSIDGTSWDIQANVASECHVGAFRVQINPRWSAYVGLEVLALAALVLLLPKLESKSS